MDHPGIGDVEGERDGGGLVVGGLEQGMGGIGDANRPAAARLAKGRADVQAQVAKERVATLTHTQDRLARIPDVVGRGLLKNLQVSLTVGKNVLVKVRLPVQGIPEVRVKFDRSFKVRVRSRQLAQLVIGAVTFDAERKEAPPPNWVKPLIILSIPWAVSIHTVTAFLYSGLEARVFWMTAILAPRFLASAFASGPRV